MYSERVDRDEKRNNVGLEQAGKKAALQNIDVQRNTIRVFILS